MPVAFLLECAFPIAIRKGMLPPYYNCFISPAMDEELNLLVVYAKSV